MKKVILLSICVFSMFSINAQISKGSYLVGSSLFGFGASGYNEDSSSSTSSGTSTSKNTSVNFSINPNIGYFVSDGFVIGGQLIASYSTFKTDTFNSPSSTYSYKNNSPYFSLGPYARYYFIKNQKWAPYGQVGFAYNINSFKSVSSYSTSETTYNFKAKQDWSTGLTFGVEYFVSNYVGLQIYTGFTYSKQENQTDVSSTSGSPSTNYNSVKSWNIPLGVGLQVHLPSSSSKTAK